jgi:hypothetical protein
MTNRKAMLFWFIGAICVFFGALIAGAIEPEALGATVESVTLAYIISFVLILIGGMFWISGSIVEIEEE